MGRVIMSGIVPTLKAPVTGVLASSLAVGSTVKLMEGGTAVKYLVVNQGIPENSSLYDASCDGTWLLRKDCHSKRAWNATKINKYETSSINTWLNGSFFESLGTAEQSSAKQVKIPYRANGGKNGTDKKGANGLSCKIFLLSDKEVGVIRSGGSNYVDVVDGAKLSYFETGDGTTANNKRIAHLNGGSTEWWDRTPNSNYTDSAFCITGTGAPAGNIVSVAYAIRPALVLPSNALFDETTMLLKGVK